jgi:hypothetical protein
MKIKRLNNVNPSRWIKLCMFIPTIPYLVLGIWLFQCFVKTFNAIQANRHEYSENHEVNDDSINAAYVFGLLPSVAITATLYIALIHYLTEINHCVKVYQYNKWLYIPNKMEPDNMAINKAIPDEISNLSGICIFTSHLLVFPVTMTIYFATKDSEYTHTVQQSTTQPYFIIQYLWFHIACYQVLLCMAYYCYLNCNLGISSIYPITYIDAPTLTTQQQEQQEHQEQEQKSDSEHDSKFVEQVQQRMKNLSKPKETTEYKLVENKEARHEKHKQDEIPEISSIPDYIICPITNMVMEDPVMDRDGNSFEREAITEWLDKNKISPLTRKPLRQSDLVPNRALKNLIDQYCKENPSAITDYMV